MFVNKLKTWKTILGYSVRSGKAVGVCENLKLIWKALGLSDLKRRGKWGVLIMGGV